MPFSRRIDRWLERLASVQLTLVCLGLAMALVILGTLAQVHMDTFAVQKEFFNSGWIYGRLGGMKVPVFPGGLTVGALWLANLLAAFAARFKFQKSDTGILISHGGVIMLLVGQFLTQTFAHESYLPVGLGQTRTYSEGHGYPFTLTLKEFHHDLYPGTDIPKNFSSLVHVSNPAKGEERDALIYMNHPLRYEGKTFYQASFGKGDTLSVFQVVDNPAAWAPYIACAFIVLGLAIQFLSHLFEFIRKRS